MRRLALIAPCLIILAVSGLTLPRFSAEYAVPCKQCHVNPNGGGMRNEFGNHSMAFQELCLPQTKQYFADTYKSPRLSESATVGFEVRYLVFDDLSTFRMQNDAFLSLEPLDDLSYTLRFSEDGIRENFALLEFDNQKYYVKAGRFYPAYGLRNADHTSFTRSRTGHPPLYFLDGLSLGAEIFQTQVAAEFMDRSGQGIYGVHVYRPMYLAPFGLLLGGSYRSSENVAGAVAPVPHAKAVFGGLSYDRFTLLGQLDLVGKGNDTLVAYANLTTRLEYGLYVIAEYNFFDGNRDLADGVEEFVRLSIELFPMPFVELRPSFTKYLEGPLKDEDDWFVQFHIGY